LLPLASGFSLHSFIRAPPDLQWKVTIGPADCSSASLDYLVGNSDHFGLRFTVLTSPTSPVRHTIDKVWRFC